MTDVIQNLFTEDIVDLIELNFSQHWPRHKGLPGHTRLRSRARILLHPSMLLPGGWLLHPLLGIQRRWNIQPAHLETVASSGEVFDPRSDDFTLHVRAIVLCVQSEETR